MDISSFAYSKFDWLGRLFLALDRDLPKKLNSANIKLHPEVYASIIGLFTFISFIVSIILSIVLYPFYGLYSLSVYALPLITYLLMRVYPNIAAANRASGLEAEVPYAAAYISVMAAGGISPYKALDRLRNVKLMPRMADAAKEIKMQVEAFGMDPVSAIIDVSSNLPSKSLKDLLLGYASTLNIGGDIVHYLHRKTYTIFEERIKQIKVIADRITMIMEGYIILTVLLALGIYVIFIVSRLFPAGATLFNVGTFIMFSYFFLPFTTGFFLFLIDAVSPKYPTADWRSYRLLFISIPLAILVIYLIVVPYYVPIDSPLKPLFDHIVIDILKLNKGLAPSIGLSIALLVLFFPPAIFDIKYSRDTAAMSEEIVNFLRDLVEARKTGLSPEKCIETLSERDYGRFSKKLRVIANKLKWGIPLSKILEDEMRESKNWFISINLFLLIDSIDVGGGTPEALEALASFGEEILLLEKEKKSSVKPLVLIPYIGGLITLFTAAIFLSFVQNLAALAKFAFSFANFATLFLPPIVLNAVLSGLVAGKTSSERVSAGFLHSSILSILTIIVILFLPYFAGLLSIGV